MRTPRDSIYAGHRYPAEIISYAVWLYFRFPLSLRMVEEMLAARGISVTHETIRQWSLKFGREFANRIRQRAPRRGDKWHLDEVVISVAGRKHWLWRAVDQDGFVLDVLVQSRRDKKAAKRLFRKLLKKLRGDGMTLRFCYEARPPARGRSAWSRKGIDQPFWSLISPQKPYLRPCCLLRRVMNPSWSSTPGSAARRSASRTHDNRSLAASGYCFDE